MSESDNYNDENVNDHEDLLIEASRLFEAYKTTGFYKKSAGALFQYFTALKTAGFNNDQAFEITKNGNRQM